MQISIVACAAFACGVFDRVRGSDAGSIVRAVCTFLAGIVLVTIAAGEYTPFAAAGGFLWWLGEKPGWGNPMGNYSGHFNGNYEVWQIGPLKKNYRLAVAVRGVIWGLPMLGLYPWVPEVVVIPLAMGAAFPAACELGQWQTNHFDFKKGDYHWVTEFSRGVLCATFVALLAQPLSI